MNPQSSLTNRLDAICIVHTAFRTFADLLNAEGGYRPTINLRDAGDAAGAMALLAVQYDQQQAQRGDPRRAHVIRPEIVKRVEPVSRRLVGPGGVILAIDLEDPETPAMVYSKGEKFSATWNCATEIGELSGFDPHSQADTAQLTPAQIEWLETFADEVDAAYAKARPDREASSVEINGIRQGNLEVSLTSDAYDYNTEFYTLEVTEFDGDGDEGIENDADISMLPISASPGEKSAYLSAAIASVQAEYAKGSIRRTASTAAKAGIEAVTAMSTPAARPRP
jgi:hypothetical protein